MPIRIGVFIPNGAQTLDMACVDVLGSMSREYMELLEDLPSHVAPMAPNTTIYYINSPSQGDEILLTSGATLKATHNYNDAQVAPGQLDIVMVPGPDPTSTFEAGATNWLRAHFETGKVDVLSVCTGIFLIGASGIGNGKTVSGPRGLQTQIKQKYPEMKLAGEKYRWVRDGNLWSSGGITNGNDLMAAYARERSDLWPSSICEIGLKLTDVGDRAQIYDQGQSSFFMATGWHIGRAWISSLMPGKRAQVA